MENLVKLTKKEKAILETFARPFSTTEICTRIDELTQNAIKFIWTELELVNTTLVNEKVEVTVPASSRTETVSATALGGGTTRWERTVHQPEYTTKRTLFELGWLRFNRGTAMVGVEINERFYIHKKFYDHFKTTPTRIEQFIYNTINTDPVFIGDDFPRIQVRELVEVERIGDWVIAK